VTIPSTAFGVGATATGTGIGATIPSTAFGVGTTATSTGGQSLGRRILNFATGRGGQMAADIGRTAAGAAQSAAENRLEQARILAQLYNTQATVAQQQNQAERQAQGIGLRRAMLTSQLQAPPTATVTPPPALAGRMGTITMPTPNPASRAALLEQLGRPIPVYRPPTLPTVGGSSAAETILGLVGLGGTFAGAGSGR